MAQSITPVAKALYLCDGAIGFPNQKTDVMGLFNSIRPETYPHVQEQLVVFAQLSGGLGQVPFLSIYAKQRPISLYIPDLHDS